MNVWEGRQERFDLMTLACSRELKDTKRLERSLGTLGGGNHFIEIDEAADGTKYLVIHSGSRNLGKQVAEYYQNLAVRLDRGYDEYLEKREELIRTYKEQGRRKEIQEALKQLQWKPDEAQMPEDLCYLTGKTIWKPICTTWRSASSLHAGTGKKWRKSCWNEPALPAPMRSTRFITISTQTR